MLYAELRYDEQCYAVSAVIRAEIVEKTTKLNSSHIPHTHKLRLVHGDRAKIEGSLL